MLDVKALAQATATVVREILPALLKQETAPLLHRIAELEAREPVPGKDGKDVDIDELNAMINRAVAAVEIPPAQPGLDGKDVDMAEVRALVLAAVADLPPAQPGKDADPEIIRSLVAEAVAAINLPQPRDGKDADPEAVRALVDEAVAALPPAAPGKSITTDDVAPLIRDEVAKSVADAVAAIPLAKDGVGATGAVIDRSGSLVLTLSDGKMVDLGRVDGKDGLDGTGPEDMTVELMPDGRTVKFVFAKGEKEYAFQVPFPVVLDRGVFKEGTAYEHGDAVTFGGSLWIAQRATSEKPEGNNTGWRLAVKKGRDGRDLNKE